jgi:predicted nucleic acid-binding protein
VRKLVFDASTAILLAKTGLLRLVCEDVECWLGEIAALEALAKGSDDAVAIATLLEEGRIRRGSRKEDASELVHDFGLHAGEAEAIWLARKARAVCGTDDGRAIRCCKVLGVPFTTAVALLVAFTEAGRLGPESASEALSKLERFGRYHSRILEHAALRIDAVRSQGENL